jgi:hypothetical protein
MAGIIKQKRISRAKAQRETDGALRFLCAFASLREKFFY